MIYDVSLGTDQALATSHSQWYDMFGVFRLYS